MVRQLCIVSRQHPELFAYLRQRFADDEALSMILDRRLGQRRQQRTSVEHEQRARQRRSRPDVDERLRVHSHVIISVEDGRRPGSEPRP